MADEDEDVTEAQAQLARVRDIVRDALLNARRRALDAELQACGAALCTLQAEGVIRGYQVDHAARRVRVHLNAAAEHVVMYAELLP